MNAKICHKVWNEEEKEEHEKETTIQTVLRAADHISPLHVSKMPQYIGLSLLAMLGLAYSISFLYLLVDMFTSKSLVHSFICS